VLFSGFINSNNELKIAFEECEYFHNLFVIRSWRDSDHLFEIFAAYQWRRRGNDQVLQLSNKVKTLISLSSTTTNLKNSIQRFEQLKDL
jgi:hypothetical protein